ncbi:nicotinate-nucleotide--dimethylbenzimidazole phosphoribosyltransferase [Streptomyces sp. enrichment culture]|uniref:nicotinate-nucleotide--dimethylbenzimidazole phosphoribosyltransferase n=1 Tax=Streptomyces sp. enrichment culture TaxID=1795815 RepID=UPI003F54A6CE
MTDTGQVPGEGLPENAGMVEQPGVPAPDAYTYLSDSPAEDEDLLLPGAQGAWGNEIAPPAPEPVVETVHEPGPHETAGRDTGSVDLGGVRLPDPGRPQAAPAAPAAPRRPLHLGPPIPDVSASPVRSLADRGPADLPARQAGPPTLGPEYLDVPRAREATAPQAAAPWGAQPAVGAGAPVAETVVPQAEPAGSAGAAQAVVTPVVATEAIAVGDTKGAGVPVGGDTAPEHVATVPETATVPGTATAPEVPEVPEVPAVPGVAAVPEVPVAFEAPDAGEPVPAFVPEQGDPAEPSEQAAPVSVPPAEDAAPAPVQGLEAPPIAEAPVADAPAPEPEPMSDAAGHLWAPQAVEASEADVAAPDAGAAAEDAPVAAEPVTDAVPDAGTPEPAQEIHPIQAPGAGATGPEAYPAAGATGPEAYPAAVASEPPAPPIEEPHPVPAPDADADAAGPDPVHAPQTPQTVQEPAADAVAAEYAPVAEAPAAPDAPSTEPAAPQTAAVPGTGTAGLPGTPAAPDPALFAPAAPAAEPGPPQTAETEDVPAAPDPAATTHDAPPGEIPGAAPVPSRPPAAGITEAPPAVDGTPDAPEAPAAAEPVQGPQQTPAAALLAPQPEQPRGGPVAVADAVPAPTPPQGVAVPAAEHDEPAAVPAGAAPAQDPDDLDTRGAGTEPETAPAAGPAAPGYDDAEREAVLKVMRERRDIRNGFRSDPIPHEVLLRVLEAAHTAPSVGHSQPWDFVVIRSAETRRSMHELAMRQRDAYAKSLPKGRAKQFKALKIEAILDTPVNIVVTADPTRGGRHTLGRHTQPQMAPYSSALAVENLWLAARAEGLGVGWVSFFDEREMVRALGLPEHLEVVAYLCVGYVDEFPDEPELAQAGWSKRRPLSWVVHEETYGRRALPGEDPHDLLAETVAQIRPLDAKALGEAWERQKRMTKPAGALGMLEIISAQLSGLSRQCPPPIPEPAAVAIFAGDHGVHAQGVTPWPQEVTAQMVANFLGGGAVCNAFATQVGAEVCIVDVGVSADLPATPGLLPRKIRAGTSDMTTGPAMTREEAKQAVEVGIETARDLVAAGNKALLTGEMGIANTTASAALISVFTGADPAEVTGRGTGINDETLVRKTDVVRRALELHQPDPADPLGVLAAVGGFEHAAMVGLLLGGASLRTPVILDGVSAGAAALVARAIAPEVLAACIAGHRSAEPGHVAALNTLGLRPLVDLDLRLGEGTGALLALPLVQSTARAMHEVATFDSAGVTEK